MVFIHEDDRASAEGIFDVFNTYLTAQGSAFSGFPQDWNPCTGSSVGVNYWEGDNAFLLLALNYYTLKTGDSTKYATLSQMLIEWLLLRADHCDEIVAEGVANMYAALKPHVSNPSVRSRLSLLKSCFESTVDYPHVLDHTVRGALVFGNQKGFDFTLNFARTEVWDRNGRSIKAMSAFSGDSFINVEISAQLLLTGVVTNLEGQLPGLQSELEKMWIHGAAETGEGLPYFVTNIGFDQSATFPIIDPTCYMLFVYWRFNPWGDNK